MKDKLNIYEAHDFARMFANDLRTFFEITNDYDNISATNVYSVLSNEELVDSFKGTIETIERAKIFRTEYARDRYLLQQISVNETLFNISEVTIKDIRKQFSDIDNIEDWDEMALTRYLSLLINLNTMGYREYLARYEDMTDREKYLMMIVEKYIEVKYHGKE